MTTKYAEVIVKNIYYSNWKYNMPMPLARHTLLANVEVVIIEDEIT